jgi:hypothetical protein
MRRIFYRCFIILVPACFILSGTAQSQTQQQASVQSSGGGSAQSTSFSVQATIGQFSPIGQAGSDQYVMLSGFTYSFSDTLGDISAPFAPTSLSVTPGNWTRINSFNISWTNPENDANIAGAWYKIGQPPLNNTDGNFVAGAITGLTGITVPGSGSNPVYVWLQDINGNVSFLNHADTILRFDDMLPSITHSPVTSQAVNSPIPISATTNDDHAGISNFLLLFRRTGAEAALDSVDFTGNQAQIPAGINTQRGCEYAIAAIDNAGNRARTPANGFYSIQAILTGDGGVKTNQAGQPVAQHQGSQVTDYRIFSVPFVLDNKTPTSVVEDDLGSYDDSKWKLLDVNNGSLRDYPSIRNLSIVDPGKGFLLIVNMPNIIIDAGSGRSASVFTHRQISVSAGWNLIGNPFDFDIPADSLKLNGIVPELWYLDGTGWRNNPTQLNKWEGLAVWAANAGILTIGPTSGSGLKISVADQFSGENWGLRVIAEGAQSKDIDNYIGISSSAQTNNRSIWHEPPRLAGAVSLSIKTDQQLLQTEQDNPVRSVSSYIKSSDPEGNFWDFELTAASAGEKITLFFEQFGTIPVEYQKYLIDPELKMAYDLENAGWKHEFKTSNRTTLQFRVVIGETGFTEANSMGMSLIPNAYELRQNYPNPFNPNTTIIFTLPQSELVRLEIFDLLGKRIKTLIDDRIVEAGYHSAEWDGLNNSGEAVASGVYFFRMRAGKMVKMRKAVLTR